MPALRLKLRLPASADFGELLGSLDLREDAAPEAHVRIVQRSRQPLVVLGVERILKRVYSRDCLFLNVRHLSFLSGLRQGQTSGVARRFIREFGRAFATICQPMRRIQPEI